MVFGPGTSEPIADDGLLLGLLQIVLMFSGHETANALGPHTFSNNVRYGRCDIRWTMQAGSGFAISKGLRGDPCACMALGLPSRRSRYKEFWALRGIDLQLEQGKRLGIVGRNGAGKSTLLKLITGNIVPMSGPE